MVRQKDSNPTTTPSLPIPISLIGSKYLLFDINAISYLRRQHQLCGAMVGTLPQSPSQNLFLGLPVEIMPEEAQLLVDRGVGVIVDDARAHDRVLHDRNGSRKAEYLEKAREEATEAENARIREQGENRKRALRYKESSERISKASSGGNPSTPTSLLDFDEEEQPSSVSSSITITATEPSDLPETSDTSSPRPSIASTVTSSQNYHITPTTSLSLLPPPQTSVQSTIPHLPNSYPLYNHLNSKGYFIMPGLRFGCQYNVYPGDPLRFHSHFLAVGADWDEEIDLMTLVVGGRLGTGVKKGFLVGGEQKGGKKDGKVRTWSIEWAAM